MVKIFPKSTARSYATDEEGLDGPLLRPYPFSIILKWLWSKSASPLQEIHKVSSFGDSENFFMTQGDFFMTHAPDLMKSTFTMTQSDFFMTLSMIESYYLSIYNIWLSSV